MATTSTPISAKERAKREQALVATVAHLRIEDLHLDNELKRIFQRHVDGEIGDEELAAAIDELNERRFGPLLYPGTDVLRNVPGLRNAEQLAAFETAKTAQRIYELQKTPVGGRFDTTHLKTIHQRVFQDVFPWAGQFRTTMLGKAERVGQPATWFTPPHLLEHEAQRIFDSLHRSNLLGRIQPIEFARKAARLLADINALHPFREGNGRTQRLFVEAFANQAGHQLHFDVVSRERMVQASIEANRGNFGMMSRLFEEIIDSERAQPLRRAIMFLSRESFNWNDTYIATTVAGENYSGRLVGRDGESFMMRSDDNQILIGRAADISNSIRTGEHFLFRATGVPR